MLNDRRQRGGPQHVTTTRLTPHFYRRSRRQRSHYNYVVTHTAYKVTTRDVWYFDSGCSNHMTGTKDYLEDFHISHEGRVTFGDGKKGKIIGHGTLKVAGMPHLQNVMLV